MFYEIYCAFFRRRVSTDTGWKVSAAAKEFVGFDEMLLVDPNSEQTRVLIMIYFESLEIGFSGQFEYVW